jgi:uncharacterized membrane protein YfcA
MAEDLGRQENAHKKRRREDKNSRQVVVVLTLASLVAVMLGYINGRFLSAALVVLVLLVLIFAMWALLKLNSEEVKQHK